MTLFYENMSSWVDSLSTIPLHSVVVPFILGRHYLVVCIKDSILNRSEHRPFDCEMILGDNFYIVNTNLSW